ncbi:hypothetical protein LIER_29799 [Lithospermum erythrorhizon]|uniref:Uncharacterized protein n=1 Tax=Lithospermum erythrorhizon TaxID=34254 RepID=A0AAV3RNX7_LITER
MDADIPCVADIEPVIAKAANVGMIPSVTNSNAKVVENLERPFVGRSIYHTMHEHIQEVIPEETGPKKKSKKRKHNNGDDVGEFFVPKKNLSKEEKAAKKARKAERRARRAAQEAVDTQAAKDDVPEEVTICFPTGCR